MSALADALVAAQRRALGAIEKQYVAGKLTREGACTCLNLIGLNDEVDQDRLFFALDMIRDYGAALPAEPTNGKPQDERATTAQWNLIGKMASERKLTPPEPPLTKAQASAVIDEMQSGSYDVAKWNPGF